MSNSKVMDLSFPTIPTHYIGILRHCGLCGLPRSVRSHAPATTTGVSPLSVQAWPLPLLLGSQLLGIVLVRGQGHDHSRLQDTSGTVL